MESGNFNDYETTNSRVFIVMLNEADLVYSTETGTVFSILAGATQPQTQDSPNKL